MKKCILSFFAAITLLAACDPEDTTSNRYNQRCDVEVVKLPVDSLNITNDTINYTDCGHKYMSDNTYQVVLNDSLKLNYQISGSTAYGGSYGLVYTIGELEGSGYYDLLGTRTSQLTDTLNNMIITIYKK
jgi:hypothetical protein